MYHKAGGVRQHNLDGRNDHNLHWHTGRPTMARIFVSITYLSISDLHFYFNGLKPKPPKPNRYNLGGYGYILMVMVTVMVGRIEKPKNMVMVVLLSKPNRFIRCSPLYLNIAISSPFHGEKNMLTFL